MLVVRVLTSDISLASCCRRVVFSSIAVVLLSEVAVLVEFSLVYDSVKVVLRVSSFSDVVRSFLTCGANAATMESSSQGMILEMSSSACVERFRS